MLSGFRSPEVRYPSPFVEVANHPNGLPEQGDRYVSQNYVNVVIEQKKPAQSTKPRLTVSPNPFAAGAVATLTFRIPGDRLRNGIYICRIHVDDRTLSRRVLLVR